MKSYDFYDTDGEFVVSARAENYDKAWEQVSDKMTALGIEKYEADFASEKVEDYND